MKGLLMLDDRAAKSIPSLALISALGFALGCSSDADKAHNDAAVEHPSADGTAIVLDASIRNDDAVAAVDTHLAASTEAGAVDAETTSVAERCALWAIANCGRFRDCEPLPLVVNFGTVEKCIERWSLYCSIYANLPGATWPTIGCSQATTSMPCIDYINKDPVECYAPGLYPDGEDCSEPEQCQGRRCTHTSGATCGKCGQLAAAGDACTDDYQCQQGLLCANEVCTIPGTLNAPCSATQPCLHSLMCSSAGQCATPGTIGASCSSDADCDWMTGNSLCDTSNNVCLEYTVSDSTCGWNTANTILIYCSASGNCTSEGTCKPAVAINAVCNYDTGLYCMWPVSCDSSTDVCTLDNPSMTCTAPVGS